MQAAIDFVLAIDRLKSVTRKVKPLGLDRYENSAEHSWQLALFARTLAPYAGDPVAIDRVTAMLLVHDLGEIETGDTIAFADIDWAAMKARERNAVAALFAGLPQAQGDEFLALWDEFEAGESAEARFANAVDRAMPVLLNLANDGQSWRENAISYDRVVARVAAPIRDGCPALWEHLAPRLAEARDAGLFGA